MYISNESGKNNYAEFCQKYLESNTKKKELYNSKREEKIFLVDKEWMNQFKDKIGFKKVMEEIKKRKIKKITEKDIEWINQILKKETEVKIKTYSKKSLIESIYEQKESFELVGEEIYNIIKNSGYEDRENEKSKNGFNMLYKNGKQVIRINETTVMILFKEKDEDEDQSEIIFIFESTNKKEQETIINDFILTDDDTSDWLKKIGYKKNEDKITYKKVTFIINTNVELKQTLIGESYQNFDKISEKQTKVKELISDKNSESTYISKNISTTFPNRVVKKVNKSSFVITTIQSLAQIIEFSSYFLSKKIKKKEDKIAGDFKDYIENLWTDSKDIFIPKDFMIKLMEMRDDDKLSLDEEYEPYDFYEFILRKLNSELNGVDPNIKNYFDNFTKKYKDEVASLKKYIENYVKNNNSIISQIFNGIMKINASCDFCQGDEKIEYKNFNIIDIDIYDFCNNQHLEGNSLTNFSLEELIKFYFKERKEEMKEKRKCPDCGKEAGKTIEKKIIELPNYLIFRINWGDFEPDKGFKCKLDYIKPGYENLEIDELIEIKKEYLNYTAFNDNNKIENSVQFQLFSTIGYFIDENNNNKLIYISKYRIKERRWFNFWSNGKGKEKGTYTDNFTSPCLLFYEKI